MKAVFDTQDAIPEGMREEYVEQDGKWVLNVEGDHPATQKIVQDANAKVGEFRQNNINLMKERDELNQRLAAFKDVDPAKYKELQTKIAELEKKGVKGSDDISALVQKAVTDAVGPLNTQLEEIKTREQEATKKLGLQSVKDRLRQAAVKAGIREEAVPDFVQRALASGDVDGDKINFRNEDGSPRYSQQRAGELLSELEFAESLQKAAPHLYKPSTGGDAGGSGNGGRPAPTGTFSVGPKGELGADFLNNIDKIADGKMTRAQ